MDQFLQHTTSPWTLPGGLHANDEDDQRRLSAFLKSHPVIEQAVAERIASMPWHAATTTPPPPIAVQPQLQLVAQVPQVVVADPIASTPSKSPRSTVAPTHRPVLPGPLPKRTKRFKEACIQYADRYKLNLKAQGGRTSDDKDRLFDHLLDFLHVKYPELGEDPFVQEIDASHLSDFLAMQAKRIGRRVNADAEAEVTAPKSDVKKIQRPEPPLQLLPLHFEGDA